MKYDFSTDAKRKEFIKTLTNCPSNNWSRELPNLKWMTPEEFAGSGFFLYSPGTFFYQTFGGPNKSDNHTQCPEGFEPDYTHYAKAFINNDCAGYVMVADRRGKKLAFATFSFCEHNNCKTRNLGRCYDEYTCLDCGYISTIDSSD